MQTSTPPALTSIWGAAPNDIWAVGGTTVWHWDGSHWLIVPGNNPDPLWAVWGSSANDVWVVGEGTRALHWDGVIWSFVNLGSTQALYAVWGASRADVWAAGANAVLHWNGSRWSKVAFGDPDTFRSIWGSSPNNIWAAGDSSFHHWDGTVWSRVPSANFFAAGIFGLSGTSAWAVGPTGIAEPDAAGWSRTCDLGLPATFCATGLVRSLVDPNVLAGPTPSSGLVVSFYDSWRLSNDPSTPPLLTVDVQPGGQFSAPGLPRNLGYTMAVTADADGSVHRYAPTGSSFCSYADNGVLSADVYFVEQSTVDNWESQVAAPPGCASLLSCGMWIGEYLTASGGPVANVRPASFANSTADPFCFGGDRATLTTADATSSTGLCAFVPSQTSAYAGNCDTGGCLCQGVACTPSWIVQTGFAVPGTITYSHFIDGASYTICDCPF